MSEWAPSIITLKIDPEKIRDVIGKGGAVIRQITEETGTTIDIENDGIVKIASVSGAAGREAQRRDPREGTRGRPAGPRAAVSAGELGDGVIRSRRCPGRHRFPSAAQVCRCPVRRTSDVV